VTQIGPDSLHRQDLAGTATFCQACGADTALTVRVEFSQPPKPGYPRYRAARICKGCALDVVRVLTGEAVAI